jgi:hypothetical protein
MEEQGFFLIFDQSDHNVCFYSDEFQSVLGYLSCIVLLSQDNFRKCLILTQRVQ